MNQYRNRSRLPGDSLALLHIDLDRLKQINGTLGHAAGDAMLVHVARPLNAKVAGQHFVARVGGDEFVIACFNDADAQRLADLADQIIAEIRQPVPYEGQFAAWAQAYCPRAGRGHRHASRADKRRYRALSG
ncbi:MULTISPECIES: GGDEF domain-containing protein [unclassified Mesorhizobium]|uniref:diguanylate cyclase domain-containing protein n=1 Tax=unclassified Mesorhizobium TaxID=325217 RepID=UPI00163D9EE1|nr:MULTISPECIES: GGDEF domain-containing protein [unclassified Mesorhizobium]